ncbi:MAG: hypothetical protein K0R57_347 [Paenibacillaceae bacterium]|nr:hypothetical protein [Paenibacillaceae bacterium]
MCNRLDPRISETESVSMARRLRPLAFSGIFFGVLDMVSAIGFTWMNSSVRVCSARLQLLPVIAVGELALVGSPGFQMDRTSP